MHLVTVKKKEKEKIQLVREEEVHAIPPQPGRKECKQVNATNKTINNKTEKIKERFIARSKVWV